MTKLKDKHPDVPIISFSSYVLQMFASVVEPYNIIFSSDRMIDDCDTTLINDNGSLFTMP